MKFKKLNKFFATSYAEAEVIGKRQILLTNNDFSMTELKRSCLTASKGKVKPKLLKITKLNYPSQFLMAELRKP